MNYGGKGITLDAKLQQDASAWLTAKGYVPLALLKGPGNAPAAHGCGRRRRKTASICRSRAARFNSGLIQGFTTALTNVTGTLQANLEVTGSAGDPHPGGSIAVRDAGFTVGATGVKYSGGSGRVEFQGDRVHIDQFRLARQPDEAAGRVGRSGVPRTGAGRRRLCGEGRPISRSSTTRSATSGSTATCTSPESWVIRASRATWASARGRSISTSCSRRRPIGVLHDADCGARRRRGVRRPHRAASAPSVFDALQMEIHVTVPNDLVVKGSDLRDSDAPVGLGALNVTLGGDLWVSKTPWDRPRLTGPVNTVRGTYDFQGRRFDILRDGTLRFDGLDELEPLLDIRAERLIQGVRANVNLRGTLRHPDIVLEQLAAARAV